MRIHEDFSTYQTLPPHKNATKGNMYVLFSIYQELTMMEYAGVCQ